MPGGCPQKTQKKCTKEDLDVLGLDEELAQNKKNVKVQSYFHLHRKDKKENIKQDDTSDVHFKSVVCRL